MRENNTNNMTELLSNPKVKSVNDSYKTLIKASLIHLNGQKITYEQLIEDESSLKGLGTIDFSTNILIEKPESLETKVFISSLRSTNVNVFGQNLIEIMLTPICKKVYIDSQFLEDLINIEKEIPEELSRFIKSESVRMSLQVYVDSVEQEYLSGSMDTNIKQSNFISTFLNGFYNNNQKRHVVLAYVLTCLIDHVLISPMNTSKVKILKTIIRAANKTYLTTTKEETTKE